MDDSRTEADDVLSVETFSIGATTGISVAGELDAATATQLAAILSAAIASGTEKIVLDCARLTFIDSTGINVLLSARQEMGDRQAPLVVTDLQQPVRRVLDIVGVTPLLTE